jgi:hypothetical protein
VLDKNNKLIHIGDIVQICASPIKSDNGFYVVGQDGTSDLYSDKTNLTMYKAAKVKNGNFALSSAKYNICFFPLTSFSNRYKFSRAEMDAATIEIIKKAKPEAFKIVKANDKAEFEPHAEDSFYAKVTQNGNHVEDTSYLVSQADKMTAFFSNLVLRDGQTLTIIKHMYFDRNNHVGCRGLFYELVKADTQ